MQTELLARQSGAAISADGVYRYELWRRWAPGDFMVWVMLNPSTADADVDDPTIRRCISFAKREGCGGISVVNLYALRATDPAELRTHPKPEGPLNLVTVQKVLDFYHRGPVVLAWGAGVPNLAPSVTQKRLLDWPGTFCLGTTKAGAPRHPLYVRGDAPLVRFGGDTTDG